MRTVFGFFLTGVLACTLHAQDPTGVYVDLNGATLRHRTPVEFPAEARVANIQGDVVAQVRLDARGNVIDANITSGPDELRKAVLKSLLDWHFTADLANSTRQVTVSFTIPKGSRAFLFTNPPSTAPPAPIGSIAMPGGPQSLEKLPVRVGDTLTPELRDAVVKAVHEIDEHYTVNFGTDSATGKVDISIREPGPQPFAVPPGSLRVDSAVQERNLIHQVKPDYPPLAKAARVQGVVRFEVVIGKDGTVQNIHLISGHPLLVQAAMSALRQWTYQPTLLNGQPVDVVSTVDIHFTLAQ